MKTHRMFTRDQAGQTSRASLLANIVNRTIRERCAELALVMSVCVGGVWGQTSAQPPADSLRTGRPDSVAIAQPEPFSLVGLATGTAWSADVTGATGRLGMGHDFRDGFGRSGRAALFARGTVFDDVLMIASFDSDRNNRDRLFREVDPDYQYSILGDNSMLYYDVQTNRQAFLRMERGRSYVQWGEATGQLGGSEFARVSRSLNGLTAGHAANGFEATAFASATDRRVTQKELNGTGLSGPYSTASRAIVPGTDRVAIEVRDRIRTQVLISRTEKQRFLDYEIDYADGTIMFKRPIPAIDEYGNPVFVVLTYEERVTGLSSTVAGGRIQHQWIPYVTHGITAFMETQVPSNAKLYGTDATLRIPGLGSLSGEVAQSNRLGVEGRAIAMKTSFSPMDKLDVRGSFQTVDRGFINETQSGSGREAGTIKYGVGGSYAFSTVTNLSGDLYQSSDRGTLMNRHYTSIGTKVEHELRPGVRVSGGLDQVRYEGPHPTMSGAYYTAQSTVGSARASYAVNPATSLSAQLDGNIGGTGDPARPSALILGANTAVSKDVAITGQHRLDQGGGSLSSIGVQTKPTESSTAYGKYEIASAIAGRRNAMTVGVQNSWKLPYDITATAGFERTRSVEKRLGETPILDHTAISGGLEYLPKDRIKVALKMEAGQDPTASQMNLYAGGDYSPDHDVSLFAKIRSTDQRSRNGGPTSERLHMMFGTAYRPVMYDWINVLAKFEFRTEDQFAQGLVTGSTAQIVTTHIYGEPVERLELGGKFAYKVSEEALNGSLWAAHTSFYLLRAEYDITERFYGAVEGRALTGHESSDILWGSAIEGGMVVMTNLKIGAGFNFKGYYDRDFTEDNVASRGVYVRLTGKIDESFFGIR